MDDCHLSNRNKQGGRASSLTSGRFKDHIGKQQGSQRAPCISLKQASASLVRQHYLSNLQVRIGCLDRKICPLYRFSLMTWRFVLVFSYEFDYKSANRVNEHSLFLSIWTQNAWCHGRAPQGKDTSALLGEPPQASHSGVISAPTSFLYKALLVLLGARMSASKVVPNTASVRQALRYSPTPTLSTASVRITCSGTLLHRDSLAPFLLRHVDSEYILNGTRVLCIHNVSVKETWLSFCLRIHADIHRSVFMTCFLFSWT